MKDFWKHLLKNGLNKLITITSVLLMAASACAQTYIVAEVIDGDTLKLTNGEIVELIGIDAPPVLFPEGLDASVIEPGAEVIEEARQWGVDLDTFDKMGKEAVEFVKSLKLNGREIQLEFAVQERAKYGRLLAYVFFEMFPDDPLPEGLSGIFLNALIIKEGFAIPITSSL